ncbi:MAG TPA: deoxyribonuclease IV [Gaiellaceae bacterium]|nr:deoxyribonuclease IV [Gaiellaceae bacterium]
MLFGGHVGGGVKAAPERAQAIGADALQLFVQSPRAWRFPNHDPAVLASYPERAREAGIESTLVHAIYLCNFASPDDVIYHKSVATLRSTVDASCAIGADGVVFHVGSHLGAGFEAGLERAVPALEQVLERCSDTTWLLVENAAGTGATIGRSLEELATLVERLDRHPRLGVCLDSCHLWASGYDVTDPAAFDALLDEFDQLIGLDRLRALHVNDSQTPLGSNRDRHANVGEGLIGNKLSVFLGNPRLQELPAVVETEGQAGKGPDEHEIETLRKLWKAGVRPTRAPARKRGSSGARRGARGTRGSRSRGRRSG